MKYKGNTPHLGPRRIQNILCTVPVQSRFSQEERSGTGGIPIPGLVPFLAHSWPVSGPFLVHFWPISGTFLAHFWSISVPFLVHFGRFSRNPPDPQVLEKLLAARPRPQNLYKDLYKDFQPPENPGNIFQNYPIRGFKTLCKVGVGANPPKRC